MAWVENICVGEMIVSIRLSSFTYLDKLYELPITNPIKIFAKTDRLSNSSDRLHTTSIFSNLCSTRRRADYPRRNRYAALNAT